MSRSVAIFLALGLAIASAVAVCFGYVEKNKTSEQEAIPAIEVSCKDMLSGTQVESGSQLVLTDYQHGKHFVSYDNDGDGLWETVYVPLFPKSMKKLGPSYHAVIAHFVTIENEQQLKETLAGDGLTLRYEAESQELDPGTYSRMARKYPSMNFGENVMLTSKSPMEIDMGQILVLGGGIGIVIALLLGGFCMFMAMLDFLKSRIAKDDEKFSSIDVKSNRAGLPSAKPTAATPATGGNE